MRKRFDFWDILAWIVLGLIFLWLILKVLGIINTPVLIEYAPIFGAVYLTGWAMHKLEMVHEDVNELKRFRKETVDEINTLKFKLLKLIF